MHLTKRILALLLCMVLVLGVFPVAASAQEFEKEEESLDQPRNYGLIHQYHVGTQAVTDAYLRGESMQLNGTEVAQPTRDLPSKWDSRTQGWITSVKNQNPYGSCWAHAAMGSVEAYMIKNGVRVGNGSAATTSLNLSETQHCFFNYSTAYDAESMTNGDACTLTGSDSCLDSGGNGEMSAYTLQRWCGAASETTSALAYGKASTVASSGLSSDYSYNYNVCHVQNSVWVPATNIEAVKQHIMDYGAGNISYYETGSAYTYTCTIDTSSQDSSSHKWANHAITIVGWDDSIAASRFSPNKPSKAGAWLCKNSWGTGQFNQGYTYISYEDTSVLEGYIYFYDAEPIDNYAHNYQYDGSCNIVTFGVGNRVGFANNTKVANVFTAKGSELLKAVALCSWDEGMTYTVEIYKNPTTGNPSSGTLMTSQTGTLTFSGYYTIPLNNPVPLSAGDTFAVVFTQNVPEADDSGKYVHTPYDSSFNDSNVVSWANWTHVNHGNTSYYKEPNGSWTDCPDNGDYRIKAYTDDVTFNVTAVSNNNSYGTVTVNGTTIIASPAAGYYVESCDVISGTATCTINGNTITVAATEDCTVRVNFAPKPTYTVNFVASGSPEGSQSALVYDEITLPTTVSTTATGWTFAGWVTSQFDETTEAPEIYAPGASYTVTGNVTLYAVYTRVEGSTDLVYELVADNQADWSGNYVITSGKDTSLIALKTTYSDQRIENSTSGASVAYANTGMTLDGNILRNVPADYVFELAKSGSAYTIKNNNSGFWIGTQSTYLHNMQSYQADYSDWNVEYDLYNICMKVANVASTQYTYLVKGSNSYFVVNTGYTTNKTQFWKETTESTTYYWTDPVVAEHEHTMEYVAAVAPTCGAEGHTAYYRCTVCGKYFSDAAGENEITLESTVIAATGNHTFGAYVSNNNGTHKHVCSVCGAEETEDCTYTDVVTAPTATEQGYTTHTCTVCGYSFVDSYTAPLGNDYPVHFSVPAGVTKPADMVSNTNTGITLPTAEAPEGYTFLGWVTEDYDNVETRPAAILTGTYIAPQEITLKALYTYTEGNGGVAYELLTAAPADWSGNYVITSNTTTVYVAKGVTPTSNGAVTEDNTNASAFAASGITQTDNLLTNVASDYVFTLAANGSYYTIQSVSTGTYYGMNSSSYLSGYTTLNTSYCRWTPAINASGIAQLKNAANGSYPYFSISGSNDYFWAGSSTNANVLKLWKEIEVGTSYYTTIIGEPAHEHTPAAPVIENEVAATCTTAGSYDSVVYCSECGEEISRETVTVPALGHTPGAAVKENEVAATCTAAGGYDMVVYCTACNAELSREHTEVPATGHTPGAAVKENEVAATCTAAGSYDMVTYCTVCGAELSRETTTVPALGHNWSAWTSNNDGTHSRTCSVCNETEAHDCEFGDDNVCDVCGYERSTEMNLSIGMTLSLEGATSVNYLVPKAALDAYGLDSFKMVVVHTDYDRDTGVYSEETRELAAEAELYVAGGANYYKFVYAEIPAMKLNDVMIARVEGEKDGVTFTSAVLERNPVQYCYIATNNAAAGENLQKTCANMILYAAAAQTYFNYNTANLATAAWTQTQEALCERDVPAWENIDSREPLESGKLVNIIGTTLDVNSRVDMRYVMSFEDGVDYTTLTMYCTYTTYQDDTVTVEIPGTTWTDYQGYKAATMDVLNAAEMRSLLTAVVKDANGNVVSETYYTNVQSYGCKVYNNASAPQNLKDLMVAMVNYGDAAEVLLKNK